MTSETTGLRFVDGRKGRDLSQASFPLCDASEAGPTIRARLSDLIGEPKLAGSDGMKRLADGSQILGAGLG